MSIFQNGNGSNLHDSVCQTRGHDCDEVDRLNTLFEMEKLTHQETRKQLEKASHDRDRFRGFIQSVFPYIHHHPKCYKGGNDNATVTDCTCGLDQILNP